LYFFIISDIREVENPFGDYVIPANKESRFSPDEANRCSAITSTIYSSDFEFPDFENYFNFNQNLRNFHLKWFYDS